jgi:hypothetical protein
MGLDIKAFLQERFEPRTKEVPVPQLKPWFSNGNKKTDGKVVDIKGEAEVPVWKIRSLDADEIGRADEAVANENMSQQLLEALTSMNSAEVSERVKALMGKSNDTPKTVAKRTYHLIYGSVDPLLYNRETGECNFELVGKLRKTFPVIFYELTNEILSLSGQGFEPGKSKPSGVTKESN